VDTASNRTPEGMIRASIDIGTNSVLLLVADISSDSIKVLHEDQHIPRLGKGVDRDGRLSDDSIERVLLALDEYSQFLKENYPEVRDHTVVTATSAVRDASNRNQFLQSVLNRTGWKVRLLSGDDEASVTYRGALAVLEPSIVTGSAMVLDIGGGSTEFAFGDGKLLLDFISLDMGSVRFSERFLTSDPPSADQIELAAKSAGKMLRDWKSDPGSFDHLIGVAGTVTSMAGIELKLDHYSAERINGHRCSLEFIEEMISKFGMLSSTEIEKRYPVFLKGRADVILGGLIILSEVLKWTGKEEIVVSTGGIRHGILIA